MADISIKQVASQGEYGIFEISAGGSSYVYSEYLGRLEQHVRCNGYRVQEGLRKVRLDSPRGKAILKAFEQFKQAA